MEVIILPEITGNNIHKTLNTIQNDSEETINWAYLGRDIYVHRQIHKFFNKNGNPLIISDKIQSIAQDIRTPYIDYVGKVSDLFSSEEWPNTIISEKNTLSSTTFQNLCYLICLQKIFHDDKIPKTSKIFLFTESRGLAEGIANNSNILNIDGVIVHK